MTAPKHFDETARLEALRRYQILDTPREEAFDDITRLASYVCEAPVALVSLVDTDRQWFKSEVGLGMSETPLNASICAHALLQPGLFIVPDLAEDDRFRSNPLITGDPNLRFYAGALLESADGYPVGTLCVLDYKPRTLTETQKEALISLGRQAMAQMELRLRIRETEALNQRLQATMAESHHRIKNNLQVLSALVEMQLMSGGETVPSSELQRLSQHIRSLAAIHDLLTQDAKGSATMNRLAARLLLRRLVDTIQPLLGERHVRLEADEVEISVKQGTTLTVLVNEMVSNAVKHGRGEIGIALRNAGETAILDVTDDGAGFPPDFDPVTAANTGLDLIDSLSRWDLRGDVVFENRPEGGARVRISFPV